MRNVCSLLIAAIFSLYATTAFGGEDFVRFLDTLYREAAQAGIERPLWDKVFAGVTEPDSAVLEKARYQPEFTTEIWDYLDARVHSLAISKGQRMARYYARTLDSVEQRFGVEREIILAIWSMESNYGAVLDNPQRLHYVPGALATLAYGDKKRRRFAEKQLLAALQIVAAGDVAPSDLLGSWAGAMGHTQFIPTSYLAYGIDMDGNGRRDIWNSVPDALATAANLLARNGWRSGRTWGYEVVLPPGGERYAEKTFTLEKWSELGFARPRNGRFPRPDDRALLKLPAGKQGPAFLMLRNFFILKRYNNADAYALAVGLLADRLSGHGGLVRNWPRPPGTLKAEEKLELQRLLAEKGLYQGEIDGHIGEGTRSAVRSFQQRAGQEVDGMVSRRLLEDLRHQ